MTDTDIERHEPPGRAPSGEEMAPDEQRQAFGRLLLLLAAGGFASIYFGVLKTVLVIVAVIVMIMLHEFGHFMTAKWAGMKVTEYFLGFGPRLWSVRRGETEYGIKAIPAGGYVRIIGMNNLEEVDPEDEPRTYRQKGYWQRLSVAIAGSAVHFILAFILLWVIHATVGVVRSDGPLIEVGAISGTTTGVSPARDAGFQPGDRILRVDGQRYDYDTMKDVQEYIRARPGQPLEFTVQRGEESLTLRPTPVMWSETGVDPPEDVDPDDGFVGIAMGRATKVESANPLAAMGRAGGDFGQLTSLTFKALGSLASFDGIEKYGNQLTGSGPVSIEETQDEPRLLSPVGLVRLASSTADSGIRSVLWLLVMINVFVGIFNMVPLPPFDGGHVAVATYEAVRSRKGRRHMVDMAKLLPVAYLVVLLLVFLGVTSLYLDIFRPIQS